MVRKASYGYKACISCKMLVDKKEKICPNCGSKDFSDEWSGMIIIFNVKESQLASILNIKKEGMYAIKVR
ncbi:MAG: transcription elongation factor subunit Spt4 [Thermoproteota archaeon]|jgi:DNA-directed RNA polymerase subunit E"|nr:transcription elongation factor subunit Spt4 [Thermoproteota archaeon]